MHELGNVELVWAVKTDAISSVFLDPGASQFLLKVNAHNIIANILKVVHCRILYYTYRFNLIFLKEVGSDRDESPKLPSKRLKYMVSKHDPAAENTLGKTTFFEF